MDRRAFSIIELLIVLTVMMVIVAISVPSIATARERSRFVNWKGYSQNLRVDQDLIAYWNFEEQDSGDELWNRAAGNALEQARAQLEPKMFDGEISGENPDERWTDGRWIGKGALNFGGVGSQEWVKVDDHVEFRRTENNKRDFSMVVWFQTNELQVSWQTLFAKGDNSWRMHRALTNHSMTVGLGGQDPLAPYILGSDRPGFKIVDDGHWHMMAFTYEQTEFVRGYKYLSRAALVQYMDGEIEQTGIGKGYLRSPQTPYPVHIGYNAQVPFREWNGLIDEVGFFDGALDEAQISEMYRVGTPRNDG